MTAAADMAIGMPAPLSLRETSLWGAAGAVILAAHLGLAYAYHASRPFDSGAEAIEQALTIDLAPLAVSMPESVAVDSVLQETAVDTLMPVDPQETVEPVTEAETVERVTPDEVETAVAEEVASLAPDEPQEVTTRELKPEEAAPVEEAAPEEARETPPEETEPVETDMMAPDESFVVLPAEVPLPMARPQPPAKREVETRQAKAVAEPAPKRKAAEKPVKREPEKKAKAASRTPPPAARSASSSAPQISPARWQSKVVAWLNRHKRYPSGARSRREEGSVNVSFTIDAGGRVLAARVSRSSGNAELDQAAVDMVHRASPVPAPPPQIARSRMNLAVPVSFALR